MQEPPISPTSPFASHPRGFSDNRYVYPVLSRRAGGMSIGVNLNFDRTCNFRCVYCQIDRAESNGTESGKAASSETEGVDLQRLEAELDRMVELVASGRIFEGPQFRDTPSPLRRLNDIALSGDGEPTASANFEQAVGRCAEIRRRRRLDAVKLVLITNATLLDRPHVRRALEILDANGGEIWAKLDAGSEDYYRRINRSTIPWRQILDNLRETAVARPIVVQSLFLRLHGEPPPTAELDAYGDRLSEILSAGGRIKLVQVHTIARKPAEAYATALADAQIDAIAERVRRRTNLPVAVFYGSAVGV